MAEEPKKQKNDKQDAEGNKGGSRDKPAASSPGNQEKSASKGKKRRRRRRSGKSSKDMDWAQEYYDKFDKKFGDKDSSGRIYSKKNKRKDVRRSKGKKGGKGGKGGKDLLNGIVLEVRPEGCNVVANNEIFHCIVRGSLKQDEAVQKNIVAVGDRVKIKQQGKNKASVEVIENRKTKLSRPYSRNNNIEQVIAANIDQLVIVSSVKEPDLKTGLIDRYLIFAEKNGLKPVICVNKIDLAIDNDYIAQTEFYRQIGYPVIYTSVLVTSTVEELKNVLKGKTSVLAGQSGTGKSSLINAIDRKFNQKVGDVSDATSKGKHTTISTKLLKLPFGGFIADTPGVREFGLWEISKEDVTNYYTEFREHRSHCRLSNCTHTHEPDCAVKEAVDGLLIPRDRYDNYVRILNTVEEGQN